MDSHHRDVEIMFPNEPPRGWDVLDLESLLGWAVDSGASDIVFAADSRVSIRLHGTWLFVTRAVVGRADVELLLNKISERANAAGTVGGGDPFNFALDQKRRDGEGRLRFRVNSTSISVGGSSGIDISFRTIPDIPPLPDELNVEEEIMASCFPERGLVLASGKMGSGKSTLIASLLRHSAENYPRRIITFEAPIEFRLHGLKNAIAPVAQSEMGRHIRHPENGNAFELAAPNATRRAADIILLGEANNMETMAAMLEQAEIGVLVFSTVHTGSVAETPGRFINVFPSEVQNQIKTLLCATTRMILHQRLVPAVQGGRIPIREWLVFTPDIRSEMQQTPLHKITSTVESHVQRSGMPLLRYTEELFEKDLIDKASLEEIQKEREVMVQ